MYIRKIIRNYFIAVMMVAGVVSMGYTNGARQYIASVLHISENTKLQTLDLFDYKELVEKAKVDEKEVVTFKSANENPYEVGVWVSDSFDRNYVRAGETQIAVWELEVATEEEEAVLHSMRLQINEDSREYVLGASLMQNDELMAVGKVVDGRIEFLNVNHTFDPHTDTKLNVVLDLNDAAKSGKNLSVYLKSPDDLGMMVGGKAFSLNGFYPMEGVNLSIVR